MAPSARRSPITKHKNRGLLLNLIPRMYSPAVGHATTVLPSVKYGSYPKIALPRCAIPKTKISRPSVD